MVKVLVFLPEFFVFIICGLRKRQNNPTSRLSFFKLLFYYFTLSRAFHSSICRWFSTWVWVTANFIIIIPFRVFHTSVSWWPFFLGCEWQKVLSILLTILADLNNAVVKMVSTRPVISKSSSLCTNPSVTLPRAPIVIITFMFYRGFF